MHARTHMLGGPGETSRLVFRAAAIFLVLSLIAFAVFATLYYFERQSILLELPADLVGDALTHTVRRLGTAFGFAELVVFIVSVAMGRLSARRDAAERATRELALFPAFNPEPVFCVEADGAITFANAAAENFSARSRSTAAPGATSFRKSRRFSNRTRPPAENDASANSPSADASFSSPSCATRKRAARSSTARTSPN
ncbi:MAG: hypothetical protein M5R36_11050 [Deltaproteobacteria bacterium]|nr:hypothetical protein [Deltaproteobacteria bacterium]